MYSKHQSSLTIVWWIICEAPVLSFLKTYIIITTVDLKLPPTMFFKMFSLSKIFLHNYQWHFLNLISDPVTHQVLLSKRDSVFEEFIDLINPTAPHRVALAGSLLATVLLIRTLAFPSVHRQSVQRGQRTQMRRSGSRMQLSLPARVQHAAAGGVCEHVPDHPECVLLANLGVWFTEQTLQRAEWDPWADAKQSGLFF